MSHKVSRTDGANAKALDPIMLDELALVFAQAAVDSFFHEQHSKDVHTRTASRADPGALSSSAGAGASLILEVGGVEVGARHDRIGADNSDAGIPRHQNRFNE